MFKKNIIILAIFLVILIIGGIIFINAKSKSNSDIKVIELSLPSEPKTVVYETDRVIINFGLSDFQNYLKQTIGGSGPVLLRLSKEQLVTLQSFIEEQSKNKDKIEISNLIEEKRLGTTALVIADLLETGKYTLYDKNKNIYINKIKIDSYDICEGSFSCNQLERGRKFILPDDDTVFFRIVDAIS
jgi:uncharacterized membrane-anchored protein